VKSKSAHILPSKKVSPLQFWKETLFDSALDAAIGINSQAEIFEWNHFSESLFGKTRNEALGSALTDIIPEFKFLMSHSIYSNPTSNWIGPKLQQTRKELTTFGKQGEPIYLELTTIPLNTENELFFCLYLRNISDSKPYDEFIQVASHELRTPLTSLKLQNTLAKKAFERDQTLSFERLQKLLEISERQLGRLNHLVEDMLDVSKIAMGYLELNPQRVDLNHLVLEVVEAYSDALKTSGCELSLQLASEVFGNWDRARIAQVIANLLNNAIKYGAGKPIEILLQQKDQLALLSIRDQGLGIPQESQERIFQRFERAMSSDQISGLGLGLYTVRQILNAHQGEISVLSKLGEGSVFSIALPTAEINS
jgi:PAS domain S-box-containing protein